MNESSPEQGPPLKLAVLGDFDGLHTRRWLEVFVQRGHDVHAVSFYRPQAELPGVTLHVLADATAPSASATPRRGPGLRRFVPPSVLRLMHARRYKAAGLEGIVAAIEPDVFHAHYVVEHGFYGLGANYRPYVVSAWGSDLLRDSRSRVGRFIATITMNQADLVTVNDASLAERATALGVPEERLAVVHLGIDRVFLDAGRRSVNLRNQGDEPPTIISDRALEPLYNVDVVVRAFARLRERLPTARLLIANDGSGRERLERLARQLAPAESVTFLGKLAPPALAEALAGAHVYLSVPSSDSLALSTVEAMAAGSFPVVSDLSSANGWITDRVSGLRVPPRDTALLADALYIALSDATLRRSAVEPNRAKAERDGLRERNMLLMERLYYRLAGHPMGGGGEGI